MPYIDDENREQKRLIGSASIYTFIIVCVVVYGFAYLFPSYSAILDDSAAANEQYKNYLSIQKDGIKIDDLKKQLEQNAVKSAEIKLYYSNKDRLASIIAKPAGVKQDYNNWLLDELGKKTQYQQEIRKNNSIIENILPLFASQKISEFRDEKDDPVTGLISLRSYIRYIETNILGKYSLQSFSSLGINNVVFDDKEKNSSNIGSFTVTIDISGLNANIKAMLNAINASGKITIDKDGKLVAPENQDITNKLYSPLNNLLITVDSLRLTNDFSDNTKENKGSITLRFYVRGVGQSELITINDKLSQDYSVLSKKIGDNSECKKLKPQICAEERGSRAVSTIKTLQKDILAIKTQANELKKSTGTVDGDLARAFQFQASLATIEKSFNNNLQIITLLEKSGAK